MEKQRNASTWRGAHAPARNPNDPPPHGGKRGDEGRRRGIEEEEAGAPLPPPGLLLLTSGVLSLGTGSRDPHSRTAREEDEEAGPRPAHEL